MSNHCHWKRSRLPPTSASQVRRLIDIAGRTGTRPVRALLSAAVGSDDPAVLQPHEIRYRNDQNHVIYGLYEDDELLALVGFARDPVETRAEILHLACSPQDADYATELLERIAVREAGRELRWLAPGEYADAAVAAGFSSQPDDEGSNGKSWVRPAR